MNKRFIVLCGVLFVSAQSLLNAMTDDALRTRLNTVVNTHLPLTMSLRQLAARITAQLPSEQRPRDVIPSQLISLIDVFATGVEQARNLLDPAARLSQPTVQAENIIATDNPLIHAAIRLNYRAAFELIMEVVLTPQERAGVIEMLDVQGETPLFTAVRMGAHGDYFVERLIAFGADVRVTSNQLDELNPVPVPGTTLLHIATTPGAVRMLAARGITVNAKETMQQRAPLHIAVRDERRIEVVRALLEAGADPLQFDYAGFTPLAAARAVRTIGAHDQAGNADMVTLLQQYVPAGAGIKPELDARSARILMRLPRHGQPEVPFELGGLLPGASTYN